MQDTHLYLLDAKPAIAHAKSSQVLAVSMPVARAGFDTPQMAFQRLPLELEYFATHRWADTPARMLKPLLVQALEPEFKAVVQAPGSADLRLDTELIRLQQNFTTNPSRIQLTLRAQLTEIKGNRVIAVKLFDESENALNEDAYGGVIAANLALQRILTQISEFCLNASAGTGVR
ncbi:MAG: ABC-type transport auxiliary lipoprotein family protein [Proteobacteria bacterium]|nr:ABC-type transport auxiliary lipoprotein family protein [Pseudomonadota bacterium]